MAHNPAFVAGAGPKDRTYGVTKLWSRQVVRVLDQLKGSKNCWCNTFGKGHTIACSDAMALYKIAVVTP